MKKIIFGISLLALAMFGLAQTMDSKETMDSKDTMMEDTTTIQDATMVEDKGMTEEDAMMAHKGYLDYTLKDYAAASKTMKRVLFFHATWCPDCRASDKEIKSKLSKIPANLVIFKTDYDKQVALKKKFGITHQHTFVLVDKSGRLVKKWSGGSLEDLIAAVK